jgi:hypothetical protein
VSDLVAVGHDVYGIAACTKDGVRSAELLALDTQSGARRIVDAIAGSFSGVAFDDTFVYYAAFSAAGGEIRRATRATGTTSTFVTGLRAGAAGVATDATLDRVFYARGSEILAVPKTGGSAPAVVATVGSYADDAAIVVERVVAGPGGVYAQIGEIDGGAVKSHVVVLE